MPMMTMTEETIPDVLRIPTEGKRIAAVRNVPRMVIEIETDVPGVVVEGHYVKVKIEPGGRRVRSKARVEIYADRLPAVMKAYRTDEHKRAWDQAVAMHENLVAQWCAENAGAMKRMTEDEKAEFIRSHCNLGPAQHLPILGYKTGIPNLLSVKIVSQKDDYKMIDAADFPALTDEERAEFVGSAPNTHDNALDRTGTMIAAALEKALAAMNRKK